MANNVIEIVVKAIDQASGVFKDAEQGAGGLGGALGKLKSAFLGVAAGITVGAAFNKFIDEASAAEVAAVRLDLAYKKFGATVGVTRGELDDFASQVQRTTSFSDDSVKEMQATLLRFTSVTGDSFKRARQVVVDLAAEMGGDLTSASFQLGRALEDPTMAARALRQAGVILTDQQEKMIKTFVETGDLATAQGIVLDLLEEKTKGAAKALGETLDGALKRLNNTFGDLFEGTEGGLTPLTASINDLSKALADPALITGFQTMSSAVVTLAAALARILALLPKVGTVLGEGAAKIMGEGMFQIRTLKDTQEGQLRQRQAVLKEDIANYSDYYRPKIDGKSMTKDDLKAELKKVEDALIQIQDERIALARTGPVNGSGAQLRKLEASRATTVQEFSDNITGGNLKAAEQSRLRLLEIDKQIAGLRDPEVAKRNKELELEAKYEAAKKKTAEYIKQAAEDAKKAAEEQERWNKTLRDGNKLSEQLGDELNRGFSDARRESIKFIEEQEDKRKEEMLGRERQQKAAYEDARKEMEAFAEFGKAAAATIQNTLAQAFMNIGRGGLRGLVKDFGNAFKQIAAQAAALNLAKLLKLDQLFSGSSGGTGGSGSGWVTALKGFAKIFGFGAVGGYRSGPTIVGEEGPEALFLPPGSQLMNGRQMSFMGGGGVAYSPVTNINIRADKGTDVDALRQEMIAAITFSNQKQREELNRTLYRNGFGRLR